MVMTRRQLLRIIDRSLIEKAIKRAERRTSGEIRVHIQPTTRAAEVRTVAERTFVRLGMTKTDLRNGVLLFVACEEQRFVILGDSGIDEKVPAGFWDDIAARLTVRFKSGEYTDGIVDAIHSAGEELKHFFPREKHDRNELTNDISVDHH